MMTTQLPERGIFTMILEDAMTEPRDLSMPALQYIINRDIIPARVTA
jgi:hypothetical protein